jgi:hypothetical protein
MVGRNASKTVSLLLCLGLAAPAGAERTRVDRGVNLFSTEQDVEMGKEAAAEAEKELPLLADPLINDFVTDIGTRVARVSIEPKYPYRFKVVDSSDINAFALPGGFIYVNRGILEAAGDEAEVAGVIAHEVGHVAARHGTNQLSKQVMVQMPLALLMGTVLKGEGGWKATLANLGVNLGLSAVFLSYSRKAESQADLLATQELYDAGYDPEGTVRFFRRMEQQQKREPSRLEKFFASHPAPADREQRTAEEVRKLGDPTGSVVSQTRAFDRMKTRLDQLPPARQGKPVASGREPVQDPNKPAARAGVPRVPEPSARVTRYRDRDGRFRLYYPRNWVPSADPAAASVSFAPPQSREAIEGAITHGLIVRFLSERADFRRGGLEASFDRQVSDLLAAHDYLRERTRRRSITVDDADALETVLEGETAGGGYRYVERVRVTMAAAPRGADYDAVLLLAIMPAGDGDRFDPVFDRMVASIRLE